MTRIPVAAACIAILAVSVAHAQAPSSESLAVSPATAPATAPVVTNGRTVLADGTTRDLWTLANGLRVVTRHIPGAKTATVTLGYRLGTREDPPASEGLAELVGQAAFTGRCADVPARSMIELDQLRPAGWSLRVGPHLTEMAESCPPEFLASVLHQLSARLSGVAVNDSLLRRSRTEVQRRLRVNYDVQPEKSLYFLSGEMAAGRPAERAIRYATGAGLEAVTSREVSSLMKERLCPANTVLCVVGNLDGYDLHAILERQLGSVPAGKTAPPPEWGKSFASAAVLQRPDLKQVLGTIAIIAPALTDTLHAYFTAFTVAASGPLRATWGKPEPPMTSRFQYSIATDPELVRFYPRITRDIGPDQSLTAALDSDAEAILDSSAVAAAAGNMIWLTGGELPADLLLRARTDATVIHTLSTTLAALALYADESFWIEYRARLLRAHRFDLAPFLSAYANPKRRVTLVLRPQE